MAEARPTELAAVRPHGRAGGEACHSLKQPGTPLPADAASISDAARGGSSELGVLAVAPAGAPVSLRRELAAHGLAEVARLQHPELYLSEARCSCGGRSRSGAAAAEVAAPAAELVPSVFMTVSDVAALLRTTKKSVYVMRDRGQLPPPVGGSRRLLWRRAELLDFLARVSSPNRNGR